MKIMLTVGYVRPGVELLDYKVISHQRGVSVYYVSAKTRVYVLRDELAISASIKRPTRHIAHDTFIIIST